MTQTAAVVPADLDEADLIAAYKSGLEAAFAELVRRHQIAIFRLLLGMTADADEAEVLCEQVFFDAARQLDRLGPEQTFGQWLLGLAREAARKAEEKRGKPMPPKKPAGRPRDPQALVKQEVRSVLRELTNDERVALMLADLEGDSYETIGQTLGRTTGEAEEMVLTARRKFEEGLQQAGDKVEAQAPDQDMLPAGATLGERFRIEAPLGKGGMGAVYRAQDLKTGEPVALKTLLPASAKDPAVRRRFAREAEIIQRVQHPHFVRLVEHGERPGEPSYVAMELVQGSGLDRVLEKESRLAPQRALHIASQMLEGLSYAHAQGVVHRDLKPENVMLVKEQAEPDFPKLLDLGIAKLVAPEDAKRTRLTQQGELIGTPHYISPEVLRGESIDGRSDLYSLSVMLYEMLAARPPFESTNTMGLFAMHLATPPPPLSEVAPDLDVPATLEQLLAQGLAKEPAARMPSADSYRERIEELLRLDWSKLAKAPKAGAAAAAGPRLKLQRGQVRPATQVTTDRTGPGGEVGLLRQALRFVVRSPTTAITIVLVVLAVAALCYWVARDLTFGR